jgi:PucR family transcriptional regulator, purine catabolism regulatory protein
VTIALAELLRDNSLGLRLLSGSGEVPVGWAHSSDLSDPTPFLEAGNLLLTTGTQFAEDAPALAYQDYVERLVSVGVAAVGFGTEVARTGTPEGLVTACAETGLPLLEVPFRTPFIAIARRIADARAAQEHARDVWTLEAQRAVSLAALSRERIAAVLGELARRLGAAVVLLDAQGETMSTHGRRQPSSSDIDAIRAEARRLLHRRLRSGSALELPGLVVSLQTLGRRDELRGVLAVAVDVRPDPAATAVITSAVALAEFAVEDAARQQESTLALNAELLELSLSGEPGAARRVLAAAGRRLPDPPLRVLATRPDSRAEPGELEHALSVWAAGEGRSVLAAGWRDAFVVVVEEPVARAAAELVAARHPPVVLSGVVDWSGAGAALGEALATLDSGPHRPAIVELGAGPVLGLLARSDVRAVAERRLAPLLDAPDASQLRRALETWLRHNASWDPAARELGLHRHTLKAQVQRAGTLLDLDLETFEAKAELWALLRVS